MPSEIISSRITEVHKHVLESLLSGCCENLLTTKQSRISKWHLKSFNNLLFLLTRFEEIVYLLEHLT